MDSSSTDDEPISIEETATRLLSVMDGVVVDFDLVQMKVAAAYLDIFKQDVQPFRGVMHSIWTKMALPRRIPFNVLLERIFQTAERLDRKTRTIYFSDEFAPLFGKSYMTLFELVGIMIDSLEFVPPLVPPAVAPA